MCRLAGKGFILDGLSLYRWISGSEDSGRFCSIVYSLSLVGKERLVWRFGSPRRRVVVLRFGSISSTVRTMLEEKKRRGVKDLRGKGRRRGA